MVFCLVGLVCFLFVGVLFDVLFGYLFGCFWLLLLLAFLWFCCFVCLFLIQGSNFKKWSLSDRSEALGFN